MQMSESIPQSPRPRSLKQIVESTFCKPIPQSNSQYEISFKRKDGTLGSANIPGHCIDETLNLQDEPGDEVEIIAVKLLK